MPGKGWRGCERGNGGVRDEWKKRALKDRGYEVIVVVVFEGKLKEKRRVEVGVDVEAGFGGII